MLFALGLGSRVVGDTVYCDYPPAAKPIAKIGDSKVNYERVVSLRPDLVVVDTASNTSAVGPLQRLHLPVLTVRTSDYASVERAITTIGAATGKSAQASRVVGAMETKRRQSASIAARDTQPVPKVLVVIGTRPLWSAGSNTFIGDIVTLAGGINIAARLNSYAPFSREGVLAAQPNVVIVGQFDRSAFLSDPAMKALAPVRLSRVYTLPDENILMRPGPRLGDGLLAMAHLLHPGVR
jgi:iron complex transport system substrate-binding protein